MAKKLQFDPEVDYRKVFNDMNDKGKEIEKRVIAELGEIDYLPYDLIRKYGDSFKKSMITSGIDYVMLGRPDVYDKRNKASFITESGATKRFMLYKEGVRLMTRDGGIFDIMPLHGYTENLNDLWLKLRTDERHNDCHQGSWNLMGMMTGVKGKKLVTSFIKGATDECDFLHTWIEFEEDGEEKVADYTLNAVMSKELYYALRSVDTENLSVISEDDFNAEKDGIEKKVKDKNFDKRIYLLFRDELVKKYGDKFIADEK